MVVQKKKNNFAYGFPFFALSQRLAEWYHPQNLTSGMWSSRRAYSKCAIRRLGGQSGIFTNKGVYTTSCLGGSELRKLHHLAKDRATVDATGCESFASLLCATYTREHTPLERWADIGRCNIFISAWALRCLSLQDRQCEGLEPRDRQQDSSRAFFCATTELLLVVCLYRYWINVRRDANE